MKPVSTRVHGIFDYGGAAILLLAPSIFGFEEIGGSAEVVPRTLGIVVLLQALSTQYELSLVKLIPMKIHLMMDYLLGALLAFSPWLFEFANAPINAWLPHFITGIGILALAALTQSVSSTESRLFRST
jgi:uncharacterized membrane protein YjdF